MAESCPRPKKMRENLSPVRWQLPNCFQIYRCCNWRGAAKDRWETIAWLTTNAALEVQLLPVALHANIKRRWFAAWMQNLEFYLVFQWLRRKAPALSSWIDVECPAMRTDRLIALYPSGSWPANTLHIFVFLPTSCSFVAALPSRPFIASWVSMKNVIFASHYVWSQTSPAKLASISVVVRCHHVPSAQGIIDLIF